MEDPSKPARRKVSFQEGPPEEIPSPKFPEKGNAGSASTGLSLKTESNAAATKAKKWQPLSVIEPSPIVDNDPFQLGDSDDEGEQLKTKEKKEADKASSSPPKESLEEKKTDSKPAVKPTEKAETTSAEDS